jgi:hypothetical protein
MQWCIQAIGGGTRSHYSHRNRGDSRGQQGGHIIPFPQVFIDLYHIYIRL